MALSVIVSNWLVGFTSVADLRIAGSILGELANFKKNNEINQMAHILWRPVGRFAV
jgi:hypothetical protein